MNRSRLLAASLLVAVLPLAGCGNKGPLTMQSTGGSAPPPTPMPAQDASVMPAPSVSVAPGASVELRDDALDSGDDADATPPPTDSNDGTPGTPR
jgi:predicted small lipoprotein YifL